ncbi:hypothetical protein A2276_05120 [candidate division WOR-1 bacterium RIFOXYA12_FULL_43_27]|uniref:Response regulatory domain-containing protein n=1 Tax=candidate division WOR-1 bacterium RIFOXYC2_FULL_46_14 TaxID=1802587 RepID=A0A1F4U8E9_UNCSA|nr:MAG: hypothetical protein A2276_05120 [candidate division WOR-1 bacterium RIFOXYA12_FULL_43_27]OGC20048.1 MAG: hypothetical protein A2292_03125 [candidate division WOR-1 bacterium RIFOXYB2_FULL_46_45]OGC32216.1 MAG: hypothetical protein A2232_08325 [candidate division WOR-1 bacterium RIFOXYA2_FULL_46_56]OGC41120.1 MAG: hypothetical protein A2438_07265 [candidate division WOR-1 bacterium RIFOXYC2_FULL_46_14]
MSAKKILVADDQDPNRKIIKDLLTAKGYQVIEAKNGAEAIKKAGENPDLILLDIVMPDIDGFAVAQKLKKGTKFIMLTAHEDGEVIKKAFAAGALDYISKPFQPADLLQKIAKYLG